MCRYSIGDRRFVEELVVDAPPGGRRHAQAAAWQSEAVDAAARVFYLLAGVSYYKTAAPQVVDLGGVATTPEEKSFLRTFYLEGLAEFAYRNRLDLSGLELVGPDRTQRPVVADFAPGRPLVPFGGGIDSIVTAEVVRRRHPSTSLFVVSRAGARFDAIERAAEVTGLPVVRADRTIDPSLLRSAELGFLNGHVPVTGILSAAAVLAAVTCGHDAVVMSNERSASVATIESGGRPVNHQWSKSIEFETGFRRALAGAFEQPPEYFSLLRGCSELWVAERFARLERYHRVFRSCNRAFHIDPARRLDHWCAECDKCCFIDLVLAPFMDRDRLAEVFEGREPLENDALAPRFRALLGIGPDPKPFECVGDVEECRVAAALTAERPDRATNPLVRSLGDDARGALGATGPARAAEELVARDAPHFVPEGFLEDGALDPERLGAPRT